MFSYNQMVMSKCVIYPIQNDNAVYDDSNSIVSIPVSYTHLDVYKRQHTHTRTRARTHTHTFTKHMHTEV